VVLLGVADEFPVVGEAAVVAGAEQLEEHFCRPASSDRHIAVDTLDVSGGAGSMPAGDAAIVVSAVRGYHDCNVDYYSRRIL
jgi:hypothetical protein